MMERRGSIRWLASVALLTFNASPAGAASGDDLGWALPAAEAIAGLETVGRPQQASADGLWELINGGAGIYLRAGFERVILQEYKSTAGVLYGLELFAMKTPEAAREVFATRGGKAQAEPAIGEGRTFTDYYALLHQGRYFITVTALEQTDETKQRLTQLARATVARLKAAGPRAPEPDSKSRGQK